MSRTRKIVGGATLVALAIGVRILRRALRSRRGARTTATGAHFPEVPQPLTNEEGAPARADLIDAAARAR